ncbi:Hypothetical predicted protein [Octopus vulgaris]|uniref:Uncharacterized protein n=1 Tax=Octopus vulgaris TaxID=6645 RepID=A0AA36BHD2_OCTVU|nr:Hypothetical predicted protein [Octopus vulgaris]
MDNRSDMLPFKTINILEIAVYKNDNWGGKSIEVTIQIDGSSIENLPDKILLENGQSLYVVAEGKKPRCYNCGSPEHLIAKSPQILYTYLYSTTMDLELKKKKKKNKKNNKKKNNNNKKKLFCNNHDNTIVTRN